MLALTMHGSASASVWDYRVTGNQTRVNAVRHSFPLDFQHVTLDNPPRKRRTHVTYVIYNVKYVSKLLRHKKTTFLDLLQHHFYIILAEMSLTYCTHGSIYKTTMFPIFIKQFCRCHKTPKYSFILKKSTKIYRDLCTVQ